MIRIYIKKPLFELVIIYLVSVPGWLGRGSIPLAGLVVPFVERMVNHTLLFI